MTEREKGTERKEERDQRPVIMNTEAPRVNLQQATTILQIKSILKCALLVLG